MPRKTYKAEEIVGLLRDVEILAGKGKTISESWCAVHKLPCCFAQ